MNVPASLTRVPPRNDVERTLARIWSAVLDRGSVGIHDNFFELGGDSILSFQVIARARQVGLNLTATELFQYQTIAELASSAGTTTTPLAEQGDVTGPVPLTPIQSWFFEQQFADPGISIRRSCSSRPPALMK